MEALHDVVKAGKARYIGASAMYAWQFQKALNVAEKNGWTRFVSMQNHYNLIYREEEREMLPLCKDEKIGVIPYSPLASGRLTRDWAEQLIVQKRIKFKNLNMMRLQMLIDWLWSGLRNRRKTWRSTYSYRTCLVAAERTSHSSYYRCYENITSRRCQ